MSRHFALLAPMLCAACSGAGPIEPGNPGQGGSGGGDAGTTCDRTSDPTKTYKANSPEECMRVRFACPEGAEYFSDQCGCGCQTKKPAKCEIIECFRAVECVNECGGPVVSSGCCPCQAPAFDSIQCKK